MYSAKRLRQRVINMFIILSGAILLQGNYTCLQAQDTVKMQDIILILKKGDYQKVITLLKKYNAKNPERAEGFILLGRTYLAIGGYNNTDLAEKTFLEGLKQNPKNITLLQFLADVKKNNDSPAEAQRYLEKMAEVDPTNPEVLDKLLENYIKIDNKEGLQKLESRVSGWIKANPDSIRGYINLGKLYLALNKPPKALEALQAGVKKNPLHTPIQKILSEAYLLTGNAALFTESYLYWLAHDTLDSKSLQEDYLIAELAMSDQEAAKFRDIPLSKKGKYLADYWRALDPNPISIENERLVEHYRRVGYSKAYFHAALSSFGFDDRGKVYIRWGPPEDKFSDVMPALNPGFNSNLADMSNQNPDSQVQMPLFLPQTQGTSIRGNESWYYPSIGYYMAFDFVNYGGYYREVPSLVDAFVGVRPDGAASMVADQAGADNYGDMFNLQEIYRQRSHLGGIYAALAGRTVDAFATDLMSTIPSEKVQEQRTKQPRFEVKLDIPQIKFDVRPVQFRGDSGKTRIEVLYGLKLDQLKPLAKNDSLFSFTFRNDVVFFDSSRQRVLHRQSRLTQNYRLKTDLTKITFTGETMGEIFPGKYEMGFQLLEASNKKGDFSKENVLVRDFLGKNLMISDLKLSPKIQLLGIDEKTGNEKLWVMPYPYAKASRRNLIFVYFEIYNLTLTPDQKSQYEISLKIEKEGKKGEYAVELLRSFGNIFTGGKPRKIETAYQRQGNDQTALEYIALDFSALNPGHSRLTVSVTDLNAGKNVDNNIEFDMEK
ncbi:MAG: GWxTD domain-containing protein [Patescibacteria group bacterium]|nr:GWxTD domain-containing protein [Patescibacteria group bacterium]